jgi:hypothetical protein
VVRADTDLLTLLRHLLVLTATTDEDAAACTDDRDQGDQDCSDPSGVTPMAGSRCG